METEKRQKIYKMLRMVGGVLFLILGIIGLFLPILQGVLFLVIGATLLGRDSKIGRWIHDRVDYLAKKVKLKKGKKEEIDV